MFLFEVCTVLNKERVRSRRLRVDSQSYSFSEVLAIYFARIVCADMGDGNK